MKEPIDELFISWAIDYLEPFYEEEYDPENEHHEEIIQAFVNGCFKMIMNPMLFNTKVETV